MFTRKFSFSPFQNASDKASKMRTKKDVKLLRAISNLFRTIQSVGWWMKRAFTDNNDIIHFISLWYSLLCNDSIAFCFLATDTFLTAHKLKQFSCSQHDYAKGHSNSTSQKSTRKIECSNILYIVYCIHRLCVKIGWMHDMLTSH